ncbi:hypothetical protein BOTBODRAFT_36413 [Botryobasidium botryosum FD-172 SS1]|uniref:RNA methyltransferase n=1 Tax=Botryobasidium botryosum (strain FD-172 SS1) TaxID=930990 RepID=A0A067M3K7_BOTB1|nr:hypothetical protein BOTBODRAFT_36413 [Botryobasidium botryosum FD-172 SS1]
MPAGSLPIYGNYRGYYTKRPYTDARLALLDSDFFTGKTVLDIGCNEGWISCDIAQRWGARKVVGVDIDDELIQHAWKRRRAVWSLSAPSEELTPDSTSSESQRKRKRDDGDTQLAVAASRCGSIAKSNHFPMAMSHLFGPLPIPPADAPQASLCFPHNVTFRTADWVKTGVRDDAEGYDVVLALSITKWIHLHGGDEGLLSFFRRIHTVLIKGGLLVLEPQGWEGYAKAKRMDPKLKETAKGLVLRPEELTPSLEEIGFSLMRTAGVTGEGGFRRTVDIYVKS